MKMKELYKATRPCIADYNENASNSVAGHMTCTCMMAWLPASGLAGPRGLHASKHTLGNNLKTMIYIRSTSQKLCLLDHFGPVEFMKSCTLIPSKWVLGEGF